ncbi:MAG TPA: long-chain fatty acid--CoA ligase [Burkholderiaceae bacterium]|nr:long-chain fatty acid--CoA ligase [Burkholderiaceae bacterium]
MGAGNAALDAYLARPWLRHYAAGVPDRIDVPRQSVPELFDQACAAEPQRAALVFHGRSVSYGELHDSVQRLAAALAALGVRKGDRVALYLLNSPQFVIAYFAVLKCGAVVTTISPIYTSHELRYQLRDSGARAIVCQDILHDKVVRSGAELDLEIVTRIADYLPTLRRMLASGPLARLVPSLNVGAPKIAPAPHRHWLQDLLKRHPPEPPAVPIDPDTDLAALPYTGGTTGNPKGVMLTHRNLVAARTAVQAAFPQFESGKEVVLAFLPFFHIYGQVAIMLNGLAQRSLLVLFTTPDTEQILAAMERYRATIFYGVPTLYEYLKDHKDTDKVDWRRLKLLVSGADTLHESTMAAWSRRTGSSITEGYGMTETCAASHVNPPGRVKPGSFGVPVPGVDAAIVDPDTGEAVPVGQTGELIVAGPNVMRGYWNHPGETASTFIERAGRRWLRTGDIVRMDDEGYFHFHDRSKDLIKYKGHSVFAKDIEDVLYAHPQVKAAGVIGVPDPAVGQRIKAIVVLQTDARGKVGEDDIRTYCRERLAEYKVPHIVEFRGELPKTDVGKVSRRELREEHA